MTFLYFSYVQSLGLLVYGIMLIVVGIVALYSIVLLLRMCDITGHRSYEEIAYAAFGKSGMNFVVICITLREVYKNNCSISNIKWPVEKV